MKPKNLVLLVFSVFTAFFLYRFLQQIDFFKQHSPHHDQQCTRVDLDLPAEDLVMFNDFVIGSSSDYLSLFYKHLDAESAIEGYLFWFHVKSKRFGRLGSKEIKNFPAGFKLNPHGLSLFGNSTLYFISHGFTQGGDNVFVVELKVDGEEVKATYKKKIFVGPEYGIYNSIYVINNQYFYLTQSIAESLDVRGKDLGVFSELKLTLKTFFTKSNSVKLCLVLVDQAICTPKAYGYMPNGIEKLKNNLLVADSISNTIDIYSMTEAFELKHLETIQVSHSADNLRVKDDSVYVSGIERKFEFIQFSEEAKSNNTNRVVPGGASRIFKKGNKWQIEELLMTSKLSLASVALPSSSHLILGSFADRGLLLCPNLG
jgi:hypothetical protein